MIFWDESIAFQRCYKFPYNIYYFSIYHEIFFL